MDEPVTGLSAWETLQWLRCSGLLDSVAEGYDVDGYVILAACRGRQVWQADGRDKEAVTADLLAQIPPLGDSNKK